MISFKCPHCQKPYKLKDDMAGKRATCAACRKSILIPPPNPPRSKPSATHAAEAEALAAAALADDAAEVERFLQGPAGSAGG